ncbi:MAG TPA: 50S ribosomal protein L3 [Candidatus Saccharimonadales bacterium]|nr:50S ribosomal protein L3 [Candidatus Saccharimonadales bacterium]
MKILLGHKVGMTQLWNDSGKLVGATVIKAEPNLIIRQNDTTLVGLGISGKTNKPQRKTAEALGSKKGIWLKKTDPTEEKTLSVEQFEVGEDVSVSGVTKGKGFAGGMKRHGFHGGPKTHGSNQHRAPGSIGAQQPQRVPKGQKMAGRMGGANLTVYGNKIISINKDKNLLVVTGAVPGPAKGKVVVQTHV